MSEVPLYPVNPESRTCGGALLLLLLLLYSRTGPRRALSLKLSDTRVYEPEKRTRLGRNRELCTLLQAVMEEFRAEPKPETPGQKHEPHFPHTKPHTPNPTPER
jgi:hypothetical protein